MSSTLAVRWMKTISGMKLSSSCTRSYDLSGIQADDFVFVQCANRKVKVPDGGGPFMEYITLIATVLSIMTLNKDMLKAKIGKVYSKHGEEQLYNKKILAIQVRNGILFRNTRS